MVNSWRSNIGSTPSPGAAYSGSNEFRVFVTHNFDSLADAYNSPVESPTPSVILNRLKALGQDTVLPHLRIWTPFALGNLRRSTAMQVGLVSDPLPGDGGHVSYALTITQGAVNPYGGGEYQRFVSLGRKPGRMPPYQALQPWVALRFGLQPQSSAARRMAFLVARSIGRKGTKPNTYLQRTINNSASEIQKAANEMGMIMIAGINARVEPPPKPPTGLS